MRVRAHRRAAYVLPPVRPSPMLPVLRAGGWPRSTHPPLLYPFENENENSRQNTFQDGPHVGAGEGAGREQARVICGGGSARLTRTASCDPSQHERGCGRRRGLRRV